MTNKFKLEKVSVKAVITRGFRDTCAHYTNDWKRLFPNGVMAIIAILFLWIVWGRDAMVSEVQVLIAGAIGIVGWAFVVLAYNLIVAPTKLRYENKIIRITGEQVSPTVDIETNWIVLPPDLPSAIRIDVENRDAYQIESYSFLRKVIVNGKDETKTATHYTHRLSWEGGADKERGLKCIEADGGTATVNVGFSPGHVFCFETDKGNREMIVSGILDIELELRGEIDGKPIAPIELSAKFQVKDKHISLITSNSSIEV